MVAFQRMSEPDYDESPDCLSAESYELMMRERRKLTARALLEAMPEVRKELVNKAFKEAFNEGRLLEARDLVRRILTHRKLVVSAEDEARITACADLATLQRWHDQAIYAPSAAEALR